MTRAKTLHTKYDKAMVLPQAAQSALSARILLHHSVAIPKGRRRLRRMSPGVLRRGRCFSSMFPFSNRIQRRPYCLPCNGRSESLRFLSSRSTVASAGTRPSLVNLGSCRRDRRPARPRAVVFPRLLDDKPHQVIRILNTRSHTL